MSEIMDFLAARLDEDEKDFTLPRPRATPGDSDAGHGAHRYDCGALLVDAYGSHDLDCDCGYPAQMLREIAAKRALLDWVPEDVQYPFASVYSDHPDYRAEWKV